MSLKIYYDGDCPFCKRYVTLLRLQRANGPVELVDLRTASEIRAALQAQGFDLDQGMVVETEDGRRVGGGDAVHALALRATPSDWFNRFNTWVLASPRRAALLYPILRSGRWLVLFLLGRSSLAPDNPNTGAIATVFSVFFAIFSIFHFFNYAFEYGRFPPGLDQFALLIAAFVLLFNPASKRAFFLLIIISTISAIIQAPVASNHTMVRNVLLIGYWMSFLLTMARGRHADEVFAYFIPAGQGALLVMYFFGIFHKLNSDFINPATSCAVALWQEMPPPLSLLDSPLMHHLAIYGTFAVESAIIVALLTPALRYYGVLSGIAFHLLLSLSSYAMYISFTSLVIAMHTLFLNGATARGIIEGRAYQILRSRLRQPIYLTAGALLLFALAVTGANDQYTHVTAFALLLLLPFCMLLLHGRVPATVIRPQQSVQFGSSWIGITVTALFFINCMMPYFGLKTAQTMNMFANLRLEAGASNHLLLTEPPGPFHYLEQVALITDARDDQRLAWYAKNGYGIVYYDLVSHLAKNPESTIDFTLNGRTYQQVSAHQLQADIQETLHAPWVRKWFHFQPALLTRPEPCNI